MDQLETRNNTAVEHEYGASEIQVLEGLEAVRKRPGMYIGSTSASGLHHLVYEIVDNAIDEALAGYCTEIQVGIEPGNIITVVDNGRGIPVDIQPQTGLPALEVVFTILHAGGKFGGGGYKVSGGLHGVGASVVNALSEWLEVRGVQGRQNLRDEVLPGPGHPEHDRSSARPTRPAPRCVFKPDPEMFTDTTEYDYETLHTRMREEAFLNAGLHHHHRRPAGGGGDLPHHVLRGGHPGVCHLHQPQQDPHPQRGDLHGRRPGERHGRGGSLQYNDSYNEIIVSFANNVHTPEGGMHEEGFKRALTNALNAYGRKTKLLKDDEKVSGEDCREGLTVRDLRQAHRGPVRGPDQGQAGQQRDPHPGQRHRLGKAGGISGGEPRRGQGHSGKGPHRLPGPGGRPEGPGVRAAQNRPGVRPACPTSCKDCNERDPALTEIYIVEGDSAGGSAIQGRDARFQAILPLWGKMLNVEKARADRVYGNDKLIPVITALGAGIGEEFNPEKLRYHKIIIMADADVDGAHIRTLLLTFFFRFMRPLIEQGYVYSAVPPLYKITRGKQQRVAFDDIEREKIAAEMRGDNPNAKVEISRFKGLGEMDPHELWETTMNPATRTLRRIKLEDAVKADEIFTILMGEKVEPRKEFIEANAKYVVNLDI